MDIMDKCLNTIKIRKTRKLLILRYIIAVLHWIYTEFDSKSIVVESVSYTIIYIYENPKRTK
jgi:hypothetical protein